MTIRQPGRQDRRIEVERDSALLGRHENCDVVLEEGYISNHHLRVMRGIVVVDQRSRNGSYLSGQRLDGPTLLHAGDVLTLGKEQMTLEVEYLEHLTPGPSTFLQEPDLAPNEETWDQRPARGNEQLQELHSQLSSLKRQQEIWRGQELERAQKEAERAVLLGEQSAELKLKDAQIARLKARLAELEG